MPGAGALISANRFLSGVAHRLQHFARRDVGVGNAYVSAGQFRPRRRVVAVFFDRLLHQPDGLLETPFVRVSIQRATPQE